MKIIRPYVEQLTPKIDGIEFLKVIERAGRTCYKSEDKITDDSCKEFVARLIKNGHEAMIEHAPSISMKFVCDRGVSDEIVNQRLFSCAQDDIRYCNYGNDHITFIQPCWIDGHEYVATHNLQDRYETPHQQVNLSEMWFWQCRSSELTYQFLINNGWSPQQARSVLPNSLKTEIIVTGNVREWRHFFKLRTAATAHPQMREVANMALNILVLQIPIIFDDILDKRYLDNQ